MWLFARILLRNTTLRVGFVGGIVGVVVDLDHLPIFGASRAWHYPLLYASVFVGLCCLAYLAGLWIRSVLNYYKEM